MPIRNSVKAIIVKDSKVLLTKNEDAEGYFYLFPGGGQEHGETFHETVARECVEEIGSNVEVKSLVHIREYIGKNHEHAHTDSHVHQIEYYFECEIEDGQEASIPSNPDSHQVGQEWLPIPDLMDYRIYPKGIRKHIRKFKSGQRNMVYLGDLN